MNNWQILLDELAMDQLFDLRQQTGDAESYGLAVACVQRGYVGVPAHRALEMLADNRWLKIIESWSCDRGSMAPNRGDARRGTWL